MMESTVSTNWLNETDSLDVDIQFRGTVWMMYRPRKCGFCGVAEVKETDSSQLSQETSLFEITAGLRHIL